MIEYVLFILTKWRNGYPNAKNIHDVQYLIISFSCITGMSAFCRIVMFYGYKLLNATNSYFLILDHGIFFDCYLLL
uniref:Uncharacterized protein n=1 Tax=Salix viminalis TaxID=40686 RepID=A0A6N2NDV2_SALVM